MQFFIQEVFLFVFSAISGRNMPQNILPQKEVGTYQEVFAFLMSLLLTLF